MDWLDEVKTHLGKRHQILFSRHSAWLQDLAALMEGQTHRAMVLWALDLAEETVEQLEAKYPEEPRPRDALEAARDWAAGTIRMRVAQRKILDCHAVAKELTCREDIALCHAVGQACAVVHTAGHAMGYPIYDLTAVVCRYGVEHCAEAVVSRKQEYIARLLYWGDHWQAYRGTWADFMLR